MIFAPPWKCVGGHLHLHKTRGAYRDFLLPELKRYKKRLTNYTLLALNPKTLILARLEFGQ